MRNSDSNADNTKHIVVVGAGQIGTPVVKRLVSLGHRVTWLSRTAPDTVPEGAQHQPLDASDSDALARASHGAHAVIAAVNPATYDAKVWADTLPPLHRGLIDGVRRSGARLVLLDALYLYASDEGPLSPRTTQRPSTKKGKIRKHTADMLAEAQTSGMRATTLRAPDFWGPDLSSALLTRDGLQGLRAGKRPMLIGNPDQPHAFAHRDDVVAGLVNLALAGDDVEGLVFHAPVIHVSPRVLVSTVARACGVDSVRPFVAPSWLLRLIGLFSASTNGLVEMLPQWQAPYLVDDRDYRARFGVHATTLEEGAAGLARA